MSLIQSSLINEPSLIRAAIIYSKRERIEKERERGREEEGLRGREGERERWREGQRVGGRESFITDTSAIKDIVITDSQASLIWSSLLISHH